MSGETVVASSAGSPSTCSSVAAWERSRNSGSTASSTTSRVPERQTWPASSYWPAALRAAASRSASAKTTNGFLPPSSAVNGTMLLAAAAPMWRGGAGGAGGAEGAARAGRAGERDAADQRVRDQRGARLLADSLHDVEDTGRQPGLAGQI